MMNRELSTEGVDKAQHLLFYFKGNTDAIFCHCMEVLDLIYEINKGKSFEEIRKRVDLYQDVMYYVTKVNRKEETKWTRCGYCGGFEKMHLDDCVFKMQKEIDKK
jgi:hypothetical protein